MAAVEKSKSNIAINGGGTDHKHKKSVKYSSGPVEDRFRHGLFAKDKLAQQKHNYVTATPYKHGVIADLIDPSLLRDVRSEIRANISFTEKETDIYKIHQSGDLANLDGLEKESLKMLPSLVELRDALYSSVFREYISEITGAGPLSGSKTDMAVNVYTPGCHLLCHDDVIGSRRVSYILYLTDPDVPWKPEWGGALRLYPLVSPGEVWTVSPEPAKVIPPAFNQLSFFAVQPGESFHDVEEVYASKLAKGEPTDSRVRMAISGWYHIPQPGEVGYVEGAEDALKHKSSLAQLEKAEKDSTHVIQPSLCELNLGEVDAELTQEDMETLVEFMNPRYLVPDTVEELQEAFADDSCLRLGVFMPDKLEARVRQDIVEHDGKEARAHPWRVAAPTYQRRFEFLESSNVAHEETSALYELMQNYLTSVPFAKWLQLVTGLSVSSLGAQGRRFRRGHDYSLATSYEDDEPQLEWTLGLTPTRGWGEDELGIEDEGAAASSDAQQQSRTPNDVGGYEMYMVGDEDTENQKATKGQRAASGSHTGAGERRLRADPAIYQSSAGDEDDGVLFTMPASWNTLSIVLRDTGVLRFVKYVSRSAPGDRWDVTGECKVTIPDDDDMSSSEAVE